MENSRIADLLRPFAGASDLRPELLEQLQSYLDLLLKWNARVNLTAIREPDQIVARHFGESLFAARCLAERQVPPSVADVGSGAGFPGIPIKLWTPQAQLTLIESQSKKATFLREALRLLKLQNADVYCGRAELWGKSAGAVTLRAVEKFETVLPAAAALVAPGGRLCVLIGTKQVTLARTLLGESWRWQPPSPIPHSDERVVAIAQRAASPQETS